MFNSGKKNSFDILSKKAKIEKASILKDFSNISNILEVREGKVEKTKKNLSAIDTKIQELKDSHELVAHFGGDGKLLHSFILENNQLESHKAKLEIKLQDLVRELNSARVKFEEVKKTVVNFSTRNSIIEDKLESLKIEEVESRNYQEEISNQDDLRRNKVK